MYWADKLLENRTGEELINDSWTPSGMVHMGGLKGPVIHDVLFRILKKQGKEAKFIFGFDDADPIDGLPQDLVSSHEQYMGIPLYIAPSPDGKGSFGDYFSNKMNNLFAALNIQAEIYKTSEIYNTGKFNEAITFVLNHAPEIATVYKDIYQKEVKKPWFPLQVVCPKCGKLGTTKVTAWDGKEVTFSCLPELVKWARGCGFSGNMSPYDGNGKMPWKIEWPAKWWIFGVTIEGAGKDHASAGGSYDVAKKIYKDVFKKEPPQSFAYEHFLAHGKKMSSSKGIGMSGEELVEVLDPSIAKFLMIKTPPNQAVEFVPWGTDLIPKLYDDYQKAAEEFENKLETEMARAFELSTVGELRLPAKVRFSTLAQWVQMPNMEEEIVKERAQDWAKYARVWVEKFAPEEDKFLVQEKLPEEVSKLTGEQKKYLSKLSQIIFNRDAEGLQTQIYNLSKELNLRSKDAFAAVYISLLGKDHGPKAAWLISSLDPEFVKLRFEQAANEDVKSLNKNVKKLNNVEVFSIDPSLKDKLPSVSVGVAIIKGVNIEKTNKVLEREKEDLFKTLDSLTTEELGSFTEVISYRKLYKEMGIDWHSRRPSPEALLRRAALKKGLYTINTCVDAYNLVVMKSKVSVGAFDADKIKFPTVLRFAKNMESILLLGDEDPTLYKDGEVAYFDQHGGFNIDFNYRDAQRTAVQLGTKNIYINVDGVFDISPGKVEQVLKEACDKIIEYCGGEIEVFGVETSS